MKISRTSLAAVLLVLTIGCSTQENLGQGVTELNYGPSTSLVSPIWSPSGEKIMASHVAYSEHESTIYVIDLVTRQKTPLVTVDGEAIAQSWSIDGDKIAIAIAESGSYSEGIWVFNIADNSKYFVGPGEAAAWSPDGKQLAVFSCTQFPDGNSTTATVRLVDPLRANEEEILFSRSSCLKLAYMSWSSDNQKIAFSFAEDSTTEEHLDQIFVVDLPTKETANMPDKRKWSPSFSPVDDRVVFVKNDSLGLSDREGACQRDVGDLGMDVIGDVSWSPDGGQWAVSSLGKLYVIDIEKFIGQEFFQKTSLCQ